jgi:hypothetical protein
MTRNNLPPIGPVLPPFVYHQLAPHLICQNSGALRSTSRPGRCRNHRCSLNCRYGWAHKEFSLLNEQIARARCDLGCPYVYFGTLKVYGDLKVPEFNQLRCADQATLVL